MSRFAITSLSPLSFPGSLSSRPGTTGDPSEVAALCRAPPRPPKGLHLPSGEIRNVRFGGTVPTPRGFSPAQRLGLAFETKVHDVLDAIYDVDYRASPSILYEDDRGLHRAIPDGMLRIGRTLVVVECKLSHTERAFWQLSKVYIPLLSRLTIPNIRVVGIEICRNFDPDLKWPERFEILTSLHKASTRLGVLQWRL